VHLCILTQYYPPEIGAPQARLAELARYFVRQGHTVTVLTALPNYPTGRIFTGYKGFYRAETLAGVTVLRSWIYPSNSVRMIPRLLNYFSFVCSSLLTGILKLQRCDLILTESPPLFLGISGYLLSRLKKAKWIFNVSDLWPESAVNLGVIGEGVALRISRSLEAAIYRNSWLVTGQSHEIVADIKRRFPEIRTQRLSNGVDIDLFNPAKRTNLLLQWSAGKKYTAVYAGLHGIAQGLDQIINAAALLQQAAADLQIILIGDGAEKAQLIAWAKEFGISNITFVKPQPRELIPEILASADIALVPLKQYIPGAVPSKLYEAMASAVPVVLMAEGEAAELVRQSKCGRVVRPNHIDQLTQVIIDLLESKHLRQEMGRSGREYALKHFDRKNILNEFLDHLEVTENESHKNGRGGTVK